MDFSLQKSVNTNLSVNERISYLRYCSEKYENGGNSPISDQEWDAEYYELLELDGGQNPFFDEVGGIVDKKSKNSIKHSIIMGSLSKAKNIQEFKSWARSVYPNQIPALVLEHKIDGLSLSLKYKNGKLYQAATRGDGTVGILVTENCKYIEDIPKTISYKEEIEIRGEVYVDKNLFYSKFHKSAGGEYANPRSFASGGINQPKDPSVTKERQLSFFAYVVLNHPCIQTEESTLKYLESEGFKTQLETTKFLSKGISLEELAENVEKYMNGIDRKSISYEIDGIVVKNNNFSQIQELGYTSGGKKPKANIAVKFKPESVSTEIVGCEFDVTRTGVISCVGLLNPVELGGSVISRVSLYNCGSIRDSKGIRLGSKVELIKSGDIIPMIKSVLVAGDEEIDLPIHCPCCSSKLEWDSTEVNLYCINEDCSAQLAASIEHWFDKLGVKGIGQSILNKLCDKNSIVWNGQPIVKNISDIYINLTNDMFKVNHLKNYFGEKTYKNIISSINSVKELTLPQLIEGLGIGKIGSMAKDIVAIAPTIEDIDKLEEKDISSINGFGPIKAFNFINGWKKKRQQIDKLLTILKISKKELASDKLLGKSFCFTGSFSKPRDEMQKMVEDNGGKSASSVGKTTILVHDGVENGSKYNKAISGGNLIISEEQLMKMIG